MRKLDHPNVIPECYVDTSLMQHLLSGTVNHQMGCTKVISSLNKAFADRFAIGIIDLDRQQHRMDGYLGECDVLAETRHLTLLRHKARPQFLITVNPAIDKFILDNAVEYGISMEDFALPTDFKQFTAVTKQNTSNNDSRFIKLFCAMSEVPEFISLKVTLKYLLAAQYKADNDIAKQFFTGTPGKDCLAIEVSKL